MAASFSPTPVIDPLAHFKVQVSYASDNAAATILVAEILADANGRLVAADFETAPIASERERLRFITRNVTAAEGRRKALAKIGDSEELRLAKAEVSALTKAQEHAKRAGLDPHRAEVRLVQLYGGGKRVVVLDMRKVDWSVLDPLWERPLVVHNALFELSFLEIRGIEPVEVHDTMQAVRLLRGRDATSLASAVETYLGVVLPKDLQTSDWSAPHLTGPQIAYAAADPVATWHLAETSFPLLGERASAYAIQMAAIPAVVRMQLRGIRLDEAAHAELLAALAARREKLVVAYGEQCTRSSRPDLCRRGVPSHAGAIEALLDALLSEPEKNNWPRTKRAGRLSARRADLAAAADAFPLLETLIEIGRIDKQLNTFGAGLAAQISPITGRIHAAYRVAGTVSGRASCRHPNLQQIPDEQKVTDAVSFRTLFRARPGYVFVVADWSAMEMRAAAAIANDMAMIKIFEDGLDPHDLTAMRILGIDEAAWRALPDEARRHHRKRAKAVNFGRLFGQGAPGLVKAAREQYGVILDLVTAKEQIRTFEQTYPDYTAWCRRFTQACQRTHEIPIGWEGGRVHEIAWNPEGFRYTQCLNLPIQGACADAAMISIASIDRMLFEADIEGGLVAWLHDENVLEVREDQAEPAARLLHQAMTQSFVATFPNAPTRGLIQQVKIGRSWAEAK